MGSATKQKVIKKDLLSDRREETAQKTFKQVVRDLTVLLKNATDMETVTLYWVNTSRKLFVLETYSTNCRQTMFQDRVAFEHLYLNDYKDITKPVQLEVGKHVASEELSHYFKEVPVRFITVLPFVNNGETVALTVLESKYNNLSEEEEETISAYISALTNLLQTYLQLTGLSTDQSQWIDYEESLANISEFSDSIPLLMHTLNNIQGYLDNGGAALLCRGMNEWNVVCNAKFSRYSFPLGMKVEENSVAWDALQSGKPEFAIHFNANPKRVSQREENANGATLAVPVLLRGRRQAVFIIHDENPLIFTESTRHKLINLIRIATLKMANNEKNLKITDDLLAAENTAYQAELFEATINSELQRQNLFPEVTNWVGYITISDLQSLRTKLRLEEMKSLQKQLVSALNPQNMGCNGYLSSYTDFIYGFILQSTEGNPVETWAREIELRFEEPFQLNETQSLQLDFHIGCITLNDDIPDGYNAIKQAKAALSEAIKNPQEIIVIGN